MAGIANPGLLLRTCTTSIFNKIKDKSDTTLYFVTPDVNNDLVGVTNMQTVSLYRGENIIEDSNVIFVRDYNLPTYLDADSETIYYRHHCMESHAQSLTSTITGAPGQKLYVLFIDSAPESPTYNQIIDAFMYIWQTELSSIDSQQFTAKIVSKTITETPAGSDERNITDYTGVLDGVWTIEDIITYVTDAETGLGTFEGTLSCKDKKLGDTGSLTIRLEEVTPGVNIAEGYTAFTDKDFLTASSIAGSADIILKHAPLVRSTVSIVSAESSGTMEPIIYTDNGEGKIVYNSVEYGSVEYNTGVITFTQCFSKITPISFVRKCISSISYEAAAGTLVLNITKTVEADSEGESVPDIFTLYTGHAVDAKAVLEADHDVVTSNGCWLGFCVKNDTTDLFQIIDRVYYEIKHVENELVDHYAAIQEHRRIYQDTGIDYRTYRVKEDANGNPILDPATNKPILEELARVIVDGSNGNFTIGANTNTEHVVTEYLTDDSPIVSNTPIVPYSVGITITDSQNTPRVITLADVNPWYFRTTKYDEPCNYVVEQEYISDDEIKETYFYKLKNTAIAKQSIQVKLTVGTGTLVLHDTDLGQLVANDTAYGSIDYNTGIIAIDKLASEYPDSMSTATITYDFYIAESTCGTLVDSNNNYWGTIDYASGELSGDILERINRFKESESPLDKVTISYDYIKLDATADTLYLDITPNKTSFYQAGINHTDERAPAVTTIDNEGNIYTKGDIDSNNHYPNTADTYAIGKEDKRWDTVYSDTLDARDLTKTPILEVTDIVPYNEQPNNVINIGTRNGEVEAVNINAESSNSINLKSLNQLNTETKQVTILGSEKVDIKSQDISLLNATGVKVLLHTNESGSEFHDGTIKFNATNGQITSGTHISNEHNTYDLGTNTNRWRAIYGIESRFTNLYVDSIQSDITDTVDINSTLETQDIRPHSDNAYDLGASNSAYKSTNSYNVSVNTIKALNDANITIESDTVINAKLTVSDSVLFENTLEVQNDATFKSDIQVNQTATINTIKAQALTISETAEFKDSEDNYIIGTEPASFVVLGEDGKRTENTLLGTKAAVIGDETDNMSDFTMHGIKKYLDYTADTLSQVIFVDCPAEEDDIEAINIKTSELEIQPIESNIAIVRRPIATDTSGTSSTEDDIIRYSYTGYVYTIEVAEDLNSWPVWQAMTGNYSAKDIYFTQDFKFTGPVGVVTQADIDANNGYVARRAVGCNLQDFMYDLFAQSKRPNVVDPTYSLTASATVDSDNEVGTYITALNWNGTFTSGSYQYGSVNVSDRDIRNTDTDTGITATYKMTNSITTGESSLLDSKTDSRFELGNNKIQIDTVGSKVYAIITGACTTEDSPRIPVNNLHDPIDDLQIKSKTFDKTANVSISGHRKMFYGSSESILETSSANIRALQANAVSSTNSISVTVVDNAKHVIIALPEGRVLKTLVNPDSKIDLMTVAGTVTKSTVAVEGANGFTAMNYNVYEYKPAAALGKNTYTATIVNG